MNQDQLRKAYKKHLSAELHHFWEFEPEKRHPLNLEISEVRNPEAWAAFEIEAEKLARIKGVPIEDARGIIVGAALLADLQLRGEK